MEHQTNSGQTDSPQNNPEVPPVKEKLQKTGSVVLIPIERVRPSGKNGRDFTTPDNVAYIEDIANSIHAGGQEKAGEVYETEDGFYEIIDGETRYRAILWLAENGIANIRRYEAIICPKPNAEDYHRKLIRKNSARRFNLLEMAFWAEKCFKVFKWSKKEILDEVIMSGNMRSCTLATIEKWLTIAKAPREVHQLVINDHIKFTTALYVAKSSDDEEKVKSSARKVSDKAKATGKSLTNTQVKEIIPASEKTEKGRREEIGFANKLAKTFANRGCEELACVMDAISRYLSDECSADEMANDICDAVDPLIERIDNKKLKA